MSDHSLKFTKGIDYFGHKLSGAVPYYLVFGIEPFQQSSEQKVDESGTSRLVISLLFAILGRIWGYRLIEPQRCMGKL
jgi:hypothetical protein